MQPAQQDPGGLTEKPGSPPADAVIDASAFNPVPIFLWGRDHWTTFAYVAHCIRDQRGYLENERLRVNPRLHRAFAHRGSFGPTRHPTRLSNGRLIAPHDDVSCVEDFVALGLMTHTESDNPSARGMFGRRRIKARFTDLGLSIWFEFERHIMTHQRSWSTTFAPSPALLGRLACLKGASLVFEDIGARAAYLAEPLTEAQAEQCRADNGGTLPLADGNAYIEATRGLADIGAK